MTEKELPLVALSRQEKIDFFDERIFTAIWANDADSVIARHEAIFSSMSTQIM